MEQKVIQAATQWEYTKLLEEAIVDGYRVLSYDSVQHMPQNNGVFISVTMQKSMGQSIKEAVELADKGEFASQEKVQEIKDKWKPEPVDELQEAVKSVKASTARKTKQ